MERSKSDMPEEISKKRVVVEEIVDKPPAHENLRSTPVQVPLKPLPEPPHFPILWVIIPGVLILILLIGGIIVYERGVSRARPIVTPRPQPTVPSSLAPSPSPEPPKLDLKKYTISLFNGSGIKGEASRAKTMLETAGFKIGSAGNAPNYSYKETIIQAKVTTDKDFLDALKNSLGKTYTVQDKVDEIPSGQKDSVIVIIGSSKI